VPGVVHGVDPDGRWLLAKFGDNSECCLFSVFYANNGGSGFFLKKSIRIHRLGSDTFHQAVSIWPSVCRVAGHGENQQRWAIALRWANRPARCGAGCLWGYREPRKSYSGCFAGYGLGYGAGMLKLRGLVSTSWQKRSLRNLSCGNRLWPSAYCRRSALLCWPWFSKAQQSQDVF
jgi:hypothetical protein